MQLRHQFRAQRTIELGFRRFFGKGDGESIKASDMKRVLLLVCLIISVVELDWERDRIYLLSSIASVLFVLVSELMRRRKIQNAAVNEKGDECT